jgi:ABC-type antimicrobial peptide transport system permease subunit
MALGAERDKVLAMVLRRGLREVTIGLVLGLVGAVALTRVLDGLLTGSGLLFGIHSTDVITFGGVTVVLLVVALIACAAPARRATAIDPMQALRTD